MFFIIEAMHFPLAAEWRRKQTRTVLVDGQWVQKSYLERGYGLYVGALADFDPIHELKREYY